MKAFYRLVKNNDAVQPFHWILVAPNNEVILKSENYASKQGALKGIESCRENSPYDDKYERRIARDGSPMFNLLAKNHQIIGTSEMYSSIQARESGIEAVKRYGPDAELVDETGEAKGNHGKGKAKPIISPQKPWISI